MLIGVAQIHKLFQNIRRDQVCALSGLLFLLVLPFFALARFETVQTNALPILVFPEHLITLRTRCVHLTSFPVSWAVATTPRSSNRLPSRRSRRHHRSSTPATCDREAAAHAQGHANKLRPIRRACWGSHSSFRYTGRGLNTLSCGFLRKYTCPTPLVCIHATGSLNFSDSASAALSASRNSSVSSIRAIAHS